MSGDALGILDTPEPRPKWRVTRALPHNGNSRNLQSPPQKAGVQHTPSAPAISELICLGFERIWTAEPRPLPETFAARLSGSLCGVLEIRAESNPRSRAQVRLWGLVGLVLRHGVRNPATDTPITRRIHLEGLVEATRPEARQQEPTKPDRGGLGCDRRTHVPSQFRSCPT
jgi:hypothetical protein